MPASDGACIDLADVDLVLASTSRYRRDLLSRLALHFRQAAPEVDEQPLPGETPVALAARLAEAKARAVAKQYPGAVVIGSDQTADCSGTRIGKPGNAETARAQLAACSGKTVVFNTAVCVLRRSGPSLQLRAAVDITRVHFRELGPDEIARYVERENPVDCAGSFKAEGLGIGLFERIESEDPTGLIGLPLIALNRLLREVGIAVI
jgi:septum formation protein